MPRAKQPRPAKFPEITPKWLHDRGLSMALICRHYDVAPALIRYHLRRRTVYWQEELRNFFIEYCKELLRELEGF